SSLKGFDRVAEDMTHPDIRRRCAGRAASQSFVDRVVLAVVAHLAFNQRHMLVAIVVVIEAHAVGEWIRHADLYHLLSPPCPVCTGASGLGRNSVLFDLLQAGMLNRSLRWRSI